MPSARSAWSVAGLMALPLVFLAAGCAERLGEVAVEAPPSPSSTPHQASTTMLIKSTSPSPLIVVLDRGDGARIEFTLPEDAQVAPSPGGRSAARGTFTSTSCRCWIDALITTVPDGYSEEAARVLPGNFALPSVGGFDAIYLLRPGEGSAPYGVVQAAAGDLWVNIAFTGADDSVMKATAASLRRLG